MAMTQISTAARNAMCDGLVDRVDDGAGAGTLEIRQTTGDTLLAVLTMSDPAFGAAGASNPGEAIAAAITADSSADATGTAGYFLVKDSDANTIWRGSVSTSGADLNLNTTAITLGDTVSVSSFTVTVPAA